MTPRHTLTLTPTPCPMKPGDVFTMPNTGRRWWQFWKPRNTTWVVVQGKPSDTVHMIVSDR